MSTPAHVPCQSSAWHLCTPCSHRELDHFSWLAVLFGGFSISGLSQCDTKELFEWLVFAPDEFTWPKLWWLLKVAWLVKAWVRGTSPSCVILCPASVLFSECWIQSASLTPLWIPKLFQICSTAWPSDFFSMKFWGFLKCYRGICTILKTLAVYIFFL